ncbi:MAG: TonB-dependent receptor domain-containing protein [Gammaproteobacteria bacterium]
MKFAYYTFSLLAAAAQQSLAEDAVNMPATVVTATRTLIPESQLDAATTVYTRQDIERLQVKTVQALLRGSTGLDLVENGGYGKNVSVFMRGTESDHVLVLIDGIKAGSVTLGTTPFQFIPIDQVERIEIIRGPQSSKYGSEAIGGVIQIFTRKGSRQDGHHLDLEAGGGSYDTYRAAGTASGRVQNTWYTLGASLMRSQGFNANQATGGFFGIDQPDRDGYKNAGLNARLGHRFDNGAELEAFYLRAEGQTKYDNINFPGFDDDRTDFVEQTVGATGSMSVTDDWRSSLRLGQSRDDQDNFSHSGQFLNRFGSTRWNASWLNEIDLSNDHQLVAGSDYRLDSVDSNIDFTQTSRYDVGVFAEYHGRWFEKHFINAAIRWDHNESFGDVPTGSIGWRYQWDYGISFLANYGSAFKAPSFNELYYPNFGNPNLDPEYSKSVEAGITGDHEWGQWQLRAYHTDIDNLIAAVMDPVTFQFSAQNVDKAQIEGLEAEIGTQFYGFSAKLTGNLLRAEDRTTNMRLPRRAEKTLAFDLSRSFDKLDTGVSVLAQGDRFDDTQNTVRVPGYVVVNLRSAYHFSDNWELRAKLNNLLDKSYQTAEHFWMPDRNYFISLHYRI